MRNILGVFTIISIVLFGINAQADENRIKKEYWPNGKVRIEQTIDSMGDVLKKDYYYQNGSLELVEQYDKLGNKILTANFDEDGKLKENADGWAAIKCIYKGDNMVAEGYYSADKKLQEVKQYDEAGDLVNKKYYGDKNIDPNEEYGTEPTLAGESNQYYDEAGNLEGTTSVESYYDLFPLFWDMDDMMDEDRFMRYE